MLRVEAGRSHVIRLPGAPDWSAVGVDVLDGAWIAGRDGIWYSPHQGRDSARVWHDDRWRSPFIGIAADVGFTIAVTVDGGVVEFRDPSPH
jgi:hypothetical protein